ncbi:MAG TPA: DUF4870 domain-containing protein [Actinomycetes bacterium]|nr:DUF4870 domain-containing protein [Actinomycetes bacterium]
MTEQPASTPGDSTPPPGDPTPPPGDQAPPTGDQAPPSGGPNHPPGPVQPDRPVPPGAQIPPGVQLPPGDQFGQRAAMPPGGQGSYQPMSPTDERLWATLAHVLALAAFFLLGLSLLGPLIVYVIYANRSQFVRSHAVEALNFNITMLIAWIALIVIGIILTISIIGILFLVFLIPAAFLLWIYWLVITIVAAIHANQGQSFSYPLSIRFVT